ncbi:prephenate dehydratase [Collariella sp. IMI 366227]|nr:prephenate dehydratase [Collariella sp. IMI 366227]
MSLLSEVFDRVQSRAAPYGVVPFENSTHGTVTFTLDNLADRAAEYPDIAVCDEVYLDVHHYLLGRLPSTPQPLPPPHPHPQRPQRRNPPRASPRPLSHIRRVYSHPQAFGQTGAFTRKYLPRTVETVEVSSTSRAAELAAADPAGTSAAIASEAAGRAAGLDVLARWVEDRGIM